MKETRFELILFIFLIIAVLHYDLLGYPVTKKSIKIDQVAIDIIQNDSLWIGDILVLPGWNYSKEKWCAESSLCERALQRGYRLILPEMGKSVYATRYFPETRKDWLQYPTLTWLVDTMIPKLQQEYAVFSSSGNYLIGLSTGARGVALIATKTGLMFKAGAALSGDYDQTKMPGDNLMKGVYGPFATCKARWQKTDNPVFEAEKLNIPIYFGHGKKDKVVPCSQTETFYNLLKTLKPDIRFVLHTPAMGHDFAYWDSEVPNILAFFEELARPQKEDE